MTEDTSANATGGEAGAASEAKLDNILSKVRKLIEKANHPKTPEAEAKLCMQRADALMLKYSIDQLMLMQEDPESARKMTPVRKGMVICEAKNPAKETLCMLASAIASYCRIVLVYMDYSGGYHRSPEVNVEACGFAHDVAFFELLFTTTMLHLGNNLYPKWDAAESEGENIVRLHHAGLNWLNIARIKPDVMWRGKQADSRPDTLVGSRIKRTYYNFCRETGIEPKIMPNRATFLKTYARSYRTRISERLAEMMSNRETGTALVLANGDDLLQQWLAGQFGEMKSFSIKDGGSVHDQEAWDRGRKAADEADLSGGGGRMSGSGRSSVGRTQNAIGG